MSVAVKAMPTPMPPPESKRVQWLASGSAGASAPSLPGGGKLASLGTNGDLGHAPTKLQRPQSAIVNSMNRRLSAPGSAEEVRRSADDSTKIAFEGRENEHRQALTKASERPHTSGPSEGSARNRPLSAMASISRAGAGVASSAEKVEIEDLKREIIEVTKCINSNRAELQQQLDGKATSVFSRTSSVDETETALKRFITTNDPAQVQMAKNTLLCMVLQKHEELHRDTLSAINLQHGDPADAAGSRVPGSNRPGSARDKGRGGGGRSRSAVMLALVDKTKSLSKQVSGMQDETRAAADGLRDAKAEISRLKEERELLRATLTQAGRPGSQTIKIVRPVSAPRARQPPALPERPGSARAGGASCEGCEVLEVRIRETKARLREAEEANQALSDDVAALRQEQLAWHARPPPAKKPDAPAPAAAAAQPPAPPASSDGGREVAALKKKVAELEKLLAGKTKEAKAALENADKEKKRADKLSKEAADKAALIADLEKQLAEALAKVSLLDKRLHDASLNLKATSDSSGGALERERELLKQIECLTKEMTEALNARDAAKLLASKAEDAKKKLHDTLAEERAEADAIQKRLIGEVKEGKGKLAEAERLRASLASENAGLLAELARANARIAELEKELAALRCQGAGKPDAEARLLELTKKLSLCQAQLSTLQERCSVLDKDKVKAVADLAALRRQFDEREVQFRLQVEKREVEVAAERDELLRRLRELEASKNGSDGDKAELALLRSRAKLLEEQLAEEKQACAQQTRLAHSAEAENRKLRADVLTSKEAAAKLEKDLAEVKASMEDLRKKLLAALRRADAADAALLKFEGEREETRAIENAFKVKMKTLYEKRVKELEAMQHDFEQRMMKEAEDRLRSEGGGGGRSGAARPATAAATGASGRRR